MNTDMDLFELILFDVLIVLIFLCFLLTALFFSSNNLFIILLSFAFGLVTLPFARNLGQWMTLIRYREREIISGRSDKNVKAAGWVFGLGIKGHALIFRIVSGMIALFALYDLIRYLAGW